MVFVVFCRTVVWSSFGGCLGISGIVTNFSLVLWLLLVLFCYTVPYLCLSSWPSKDGGTLPAFFAFFFLSLADGMCIAWLLTVVANVNCVNPDSDIPVMQCTQYCHCSDSSYGQVWVCIYMCVLVCWLNVLPVTLALLNDVMSGAPQTAPCYSSSFCEYGIIIVCVCVCVVFTCVHQSSGSVWCGLRCCS